MTTGHILLVDHHNENYRQIHFLLNLCGFRFVAARTICEAENWLNSLQHEANRFDLMLINTVKNKEDLNVLFSVAQQITGGIAVLLVERQWTQEDVLKEVSITQNVQFSSCSPEDVTCQLHQMLGRND